MRRGRIFIYLALILIVGLGAAYFFFSRSGGILPTQTQTSQQVSLVVAGQNIPKGKLINESDLSTINIPENQLEAGQFQIMSDVVGKYANYPIVSGTKIYQELLSSSPGNLADSGSTWSALISPGMTAVTIPISRLSAVGFGVRDGDHINLIASMLLVDVDANYQSITPNLSAGLLASNSDSFFDGTSFQTVTGAYNLTAQSVSGLSLSPQGRVELDPNFQEPFYIVPAERQRPRLVSQMVLQNVLVLHVGVFLLPSEEDGSTSNQSALPAQDGATASVIQPPDIITLVVTPQEAVTLTYLLHSGVQMTMTLRGPSDDVSRVETEAATLQYLLSQYRIPVPAKLPYALEPRLDVIVPPVLKDLYTPAPAPAQ